jgi:hypothetical protein
MPRDIFRLKNTPLGTVLVQFYRVVPYSSEAFERHLIAEMLLAQSNGELVVVSPQGPLYQGLILSNPILIGAIAQLSQRCPTCNCVRIEREAVGSMSW